MKEGCAIGRAFIAGLMILTLAGCAGALNLPVSRRPESYLVRRGDTLYSIAWHYGLDYHSVARWNGIPPPYTIYPGEHVYLDPGHAATSGSGPTVASRSVRDHNSAGRAATGSAGAFIAANSAARGPAPSNLRPVDWRWPAQGTVRSTFGAKGIPGQGLVIQGHLGEPVLAAASGTVVYVGSALAGYGNLVIIKHTAELLSAYGQNQVLVVKEGDAVRAGQKIATMGLAPDGKPELYFEIRKNGDPVDPLRFLPKPR